MEGGWKETQWKAKGEMGISNIWRLDVIRVAGWNERQDGVE